MAKCGDVHKFDSYYAYGKANNGVWYLFEIKTGDYRIFKTWKATKKAYKRLKVTRLKNRNHGNSDTPALSAEGNLRHQTTE